MNKRAAKEWLTIAWHDLSSAKILLEANHYTDSIGVDLQQALEKSLKAIIANENLKIPKTHNLYEIYVSLPVSLSLSDRELDLLDIATDYFKEERYPNPNYILPPKEEVQEVLLFTEMLFDKVCNVLEIESDEVKK